MKSPAVQSRTKIDAPVAAAVVTTAEAATVAAALMGRRWVEEVTLRGWRCLEITPARTCWPMGSDSDGR